eukprot:2791303-Pleurochrysis_carterae.AAC.2
MESIGCNLDLRAKSQRNTENKFMTGATVDDYVMGRLRDPESSSPGLAVNNLAVCEMTYGGKKASSADTETSASSCTACQSCKHGVMRHSKTSSSAVDWLCSWGQYGQGGRGERQWRAGGVASRANGA